MIVKVKQNYPNQFEWFLNQKIAELTVYSIYCYGNNLYYLVRSDFETTTPLLVESNKFDILDPELSKYWQFKDNTKTDEIDFIITFKEWIKYENEHLYYFTSPWDYEENIDIIADLDWLPKWFNLIDEEIGKPGIKYF